VIEPGLTVAELLEMAIRDNPALLTEIFSARPGSEMVLNLSVMVRSACTFNDARKHLEAKGFRPAVLP
jgi:hypothetical protein